MIDLCIWEELNRVQTIYAVIPGYSKTRKWGWGQGKTWMLCNCKQGKEIFYGIRRDGTLNGTWCGDVDHFHLPAII